MPPEPTQEATAPLDVKLEESAPPGNVLPALARLLRRLRDRAAADAAAGGDDNK